MKERYFRTGSLLLDLVVGGGIDLGFPAGKIINIVGDKSSGKTFLACEIVANAYHTYKDKVKFIYDDAESGFGFNTKNLYGFDIEEFKIRSKTVEELFCNVKDFINKIKKDEVGIYVLDSLDGLSSSQLIEIGEERYKLFKQDKEYDKGSYQMEFAKFLSQEFFRNLTSEIDEKNILLIIISQIRTDVSLMSFRKWTRAGGKALDFYAHTVLWLKSLRTIEKKGADIGVIIQARTEKSKTPRPYRQCLFPIYFNYGIDDIGSCIDYLYNLRSDKTGELNSKKEKIKFDDKEFTRDELIKFIEENDLIDGLKQMVINNWEQEEKERLIDRRKKYE